MLLKVLLYIPACYIRLKIYDFSNINCNCTTFTKLKTLSISWFNYISTLFTFYLIAYYYFFFFSISHLLIMYYTMIYHTVCGIILLLSYGWINLVRIIAKNPLKNFATFASFLRWTIFKINFFAHKLYLKLFYQYWYLASHYKMGIKNESTVKYSLQGVAKVVLATLRKTL